MVCRVLGYWLLLVTPFASVAFHLVVPPWRLLTLPPLRLLSPVALEHRPIRMHLGALDLVGLHLGPQVYFRDCSDVQVPALGFTGKFPGWATVGSL